MPRDLMGQNEMIDRISELENYITGSRERVANELYNIDKENTAKRLKELEAEAKSREAIEKKSLEATKKQQKKLDEISKKKYKDEEQRVKDLKKAQEDYQKTLNKIEDTELRRAKSERQQAEIEKAKKEVFDSNKTVQEKYESYKKYKEDNEDRGIKASFELAIAGLSNFTQQLDKDIESIAKARSAMETRLQGTDIAWEDITGKIQRATAVSPLVSSKAITERVQSMVSKGVVYNVEQRAFLDVFKDKIAPTFSADSRSLAQLIRIQQEDSTALRLGMETALNEFLNKMYQTTEYMSDIMGSIKDSLSEAESLMKTENAATFEWQIQKWMGSLYSVGMSSSAVNAIAGGLGNISAGRLDTLSNGGVGNLIAMAASRSGLSVSDMLKSGLDSDKTNTLLEAMVNYLADIYAETKDNNVVAQQYAQVFGLTATDLKAIANLSKADITSTSGYSLSGNDMLGQLRSMAASAWSRTSWGEMGENMLSNLKYTLAAGIGGNPALYTIYKAANLLDGLVGGINIPALTVFGNGVDLETTVADLMRVGALGGSVISSVFGGLLSSGGGLTSGGLLDAFGVGNGTRVSRGTFTPSAGSGEHLSGSGYVGNGNGDDIQRKTMDDANGDANQQLVEAKESSETNDITINDVNENIVLIYRLLNDVTTGAKSLHVTSEAYGGLAWTTNGNAFNSNI